MENATKALLIAAAVLVVILIISLGIGIFTMASEQMGNADLTEYQIAQFNDKFKKYEGTTVSATKVNALLDTVFNHNMSQEDASTRVAVKFEGTTGKPTNWTDVTTTSKPTTSYVEVGTANSYTVTLTYNTSTGLVNLITIKGK